MTEPLNIKNADSYDLDTREHMDNGESVQMCPNDSREKLEAWAHEEIAEKWAQSDREVTMIMDDLRDLLDRQAAITERECQASSIWALQERYKALNQVAELTAERDELQAELKQERLEWESERDYADMCEKHLKELKAERDELQAAIDAMNNRQFYAMYKAKCDECEQLKKVVRTQAESFKKLECELAGKQ